jgi:ketosteroid isomerase-like protein
MATQSEMVALIDRHFQDLVAGDEDAFTAFVHEDFVQDWPQTGERLRGRQACLNVARNYPGGPPSVEIRRLSGEGDHWVVEGRIRYGDDSVYHAVAILELRDGKLAREVDYFGPDYPALEWRSQWVQRIED